MLINSASSLSIPKRVLRLFLLILVLSLFALVALYSSDATYPTIKRKSQEFASAPAKKPETALAAKKAPVAETKIYRKKAFMVEPVYRMEAIVFSLENALDMLPLDWQVIAIMPVASTSHLKQFCGKPRNQQDCKTGRFVHQILPEYDWNDKDIYNGKHWRNQLFLSPTFWKSFDADWVLTIQSDTVLCKKGEPPLVNYIGGPTFVDIHKDNAEIYSGHMNGGLSVRNIEWALTCLERKKGQQECEDFVYGGCFNEDKKLHRFVDVVAFATDNGYTGCIDRDGKRTCPYGMHKPWAKRGTLTESEYNELMDSCPPIKELAKLFQ
ncbi:hypothetical protein HDU91_004720 [Kappamyces sp. JEL0680]|nr:hypothetical protein HDU91_004720 [Kappamyces sp. JEL0680]